MTVWLVRATQSTSLKSCNHAHSGVIEAWRFCVDLNEGSRVITVIVFQTVIKQSECQGDR
jgi:hypothetical protein